ncbi:MAG: SDR family oxidoreductase [Sporichthyaceae bacterium]
MGHLDGRIAIITGAGRGIGREHAILFAAEGAAVVVNDLGGAHDGTGGAAGPAEEVAAEIRAGGGRAVANGDDVADSAGADRLVAQAVAEFGRLDVVVNNAGILRDRVLVNLSDEDWDLVVRINLRGTFTVTRAASNYWREQSKAGAAVNASVINTSSESGIFGNPGQANYSAAKAAVASFTQVAAKELGRYGIRVNAITPQARTRMTESAFGDALAAKEGKFDRWNPANVSPFVAYLATAHCELTGEVFMVGGSRVHRIKPWEKDPDWKLDTEGRWSIEALTKTVGEIGAPRASGWTANPDKA